MARTGLLITTWNRTPQLKISLQRMSELTVPDRILVVDDGSDDGCEQACRDLDLPVEYVYNHRPYLALCSQARNVGVKLLDDCDLIIHSEPEIYFITDVVKQLVDRVEVDPRVISAGMVYRSRAAGKNNPAYDCELLAGWVATFAAIYRREWLLEIGGWDEEFPTNYGHDDTDLLTRLRLIGHGQVIDRDVKVLHQWHAPNMAGGQVENGRYLQAKGFDDDLSKVVANQGKEWGKLIERP